LRLKEAKKSPSDSPAYDAVRVLNEFREFGETATEFVKRVSGLGAISYRGDLISVKGNVDVTRKVFSRWSVEIILSVYSLKSAGFGDLRRLLGGISSQVLSKRLRDLEELGFLERSVTMSRPPKVRYSLSEEGELLAKIGEPVILYLRRSVGNGPRKPAAAP
jgi:DNA-binding HxlR family transcriptional regulator